MVTARGGQSWSRTSEIAPTRGPFAGGEFTNDIRQAVEKLDRILHSQSLALVTSGSWTSLRTGHGEPRKCPAPRGQRRGARLAIRVRGAGLDRGFCDRGGRRTGRFPSPLGREIFSISKDEKVARRRRHMGDWGPALSSGNPA
jgi:hypothetical protein